MKKINKNILAISAFLIFFIGLMTYGYLRKIDIDNSNISILDINNENINHIDLISGEQKEYKFNINTNIKLRNIKIKAINDNDIVVNDLSFTILKNNNSSNGTIKFEISADNLNTFIYEINYECILKDNFVNVYLREDKFDYINDTINYDVGQKTYISIETLENSNIEYDHNNSNIGKIELIDNKYYIEALDVGEMTFSFKITKENYKDIEFNINIVIKEAPISYSGHDLLSQINSYRNNNGLNSLSLDQNLSNACNIRVYETFTRTGHTRPDGTSFKTAISNINNYGLTVELLTYGVFGASGSMDFWTNSSIHNRNLLKSSYTKIGIGSAPASGSRSNFCVILAY